MDWITREHWHGLEIEDLTEYAELEEVPDWEDESTQRMTRSRLLSLQEYSRGN